MSFLTGVDLERRLGEEAPQPLVLRTKKSPPRQPTACLELLDHREPVEYGGILKKAIELQNDDPLEELRRMIKRTQGKMDRQTKVLNGFIEDVNQINKLQRNFSADDDIDDIESLQDLPSTFALDNGSSAPALAASPSSSSKPALADTPATSSTAIVAASDGAPARQLRTLASASASAVALRPASGNGRSRNTVLRSGGPVIASAGPESTALVQRSVSTPALQKFAGMRQQQNTEPLTLPARRAPPGSALHRPPAQEALSAAKRSLGTAPAIGGGGSGRTSPSGVSPLARFPALHRARSTPKFDTRRA